MVGGWKKEREDYGSGEEIVEEKGGRKEDSSGRGRRGKESEIVGRNERRKSSKEEIN